MPFANWPLLLLIDDELELLGSQFRIELPPNHEAHHRADAVNAVLEECGRQKQAWPAAWRVLFEALQTDPAAELLRRVVRDGIRQWQRRRDRQLRESEVEYAAMAVTMRLTIIVIRNAGNWYAHGDHTDPRGWYGFVYRSLGFDARGKLRLNSDLFRRLDELFPRSERQFGDLRPEAFPQTSTPRGFSVEELVGMLDDLDARAWPVPERVRLLGRIGPLLAGYLVDPGSAPEDRDEARQRVKPLLEELLPALQGDDDVRAAAAVALGETGAILALGTGRPDDIPPALVVAALTAALVEGTAPVRVRVAGALAALGAGLRQGPAAGADRDGGADRQRLIDQCDAALQAGADGPSVPLSVRRACRRALAERDVPTVRPAR